MCNFGLCYVPVLDAVSNEFFSPVSAGADVNLTDSLGNSPLHACAENTDVNADVVRLICRQSNCLIDIRNSHSKAPLQVILSSHLNY